MFIALNLDLVTYNMFIIFKITVNTDKRESDCLQDIGIQCITHCLLNHTCIVIICFLIQQSVIIVNGVSKEQKIRRKENKKKQIFSPYHSNPPPPTIPPPKKKKRGNVSACHTLHPNIVETAKLCLLRKVECADQKLNDGLIRYPLIFHAPVCFNFFGRISLIM